VLRQAACAALAWATCALPSGAQGKVFLTQQEALDLALPGCRFERRVETLDATQRQRAAELCNQTIDQQIVYRYVARKDGRLTGTAYFDAHRVRTLREVLLVVVTPEGKVSRVEVVAFGEPLEYLAKKPFYEQFTGRRLDAELELKHGIRGVIGATLTARATTDAVRRVLALHAVLEAAPPAPPATRPGETRTSRPAPGRDAPASRDPKRSGRTP
jgi:hypothetical protein